MDTALAASSAIASAADIPPLKFGFNTGAGHEPRVAFLAEAWRPGVRSRDRADRQRVQRLPHPAAPPASTTSPATRWGADYPHANNQLDGLFTCGGGNNDSQYCNPAFDALLAQAAAEPDPAKQADALQAGPEDPDRRRADPPAPLRASRRYVVKPYVGGVIVDPDRLAATRATCSTRPSRS